MVALHSAVSSSSERSTRLNATGHRSALDTSRETGRKTRVDLFRGKIAAKKDPTDAVGLAILRRLDATLEFLLQHNPLSPTWGAGPIVGETPPECPAPVPCPGHLRSLGPTGPTD